MSKSGASQKGAEDSAHVPAKKKVSESDKWEAAWRARVALRRAGDLGDGAHRVMPHRTGNR